MMSSWYTSFNANFWGYTSAIFVITFLIVVGIVLGVVGGLGDFSKSSSSSSNNVGTPPPSGGGVTTRSAPTYPMTIGQVWGLESPSVCGLTPFCYTGSSDPPQNQAGVPPPPTINALQPFLFTNSVEEAGCGVVCPGAGAGAAFNPPHATTTPDGSAQYGYCQPAHDDTVNISAQTSAMTAGASYSFSMFFAQRNISTPSELQEGLTNTVLQMGIVVSLDSLVIASVAAGTTGLSGSWETLTNTFTWPGPDANPLFVLAAVGPAGINNQGLDVTMLFDAIKITAN
jgi:hypothetical protein